MKIDMRLSERTETAPMGQSEFTLVYTSALPPVSRLEVRVSKSEWDRATVGTHRDIVLTD
jgi:hypothetical protein